MFNGLHYLTFSCQFSLLSVCLGYYSDRGPSFSWRMLWSWHHLAPISPSLAAESKLQPILLILSVEPRLQLQSSALIITRSWRFSLELNVRCIPPPSIELYSSKALQHERSPRVQHYMLGSNYVIILSRSSSSLSGRTTIHHYNDCHYHYHYRTFIHSIVVLSLKGRETSYLV